MDVRRDGGPLISTAVALLERFNRRHPWSHNDHFHRWILRRLPASRWRALDVGCGAGTLVGRLRTEFAEVVGIDPDPTMVELATARFAGDPAVTIRKRRFAEVEGEFDAITMVASLHHMPLDDALGRARELLVPGGRLLVVGLARMETLIDLAYDAASALLNPLVGLVKHPRVAEPGPEGPPMPVRDPAETLTEIATAARRLLPGAKARRRLFFRYTLEWQRPSYADRVAVTGK